MRVAPDFFGKRKRRDAGDEFYRDKTRASKARVDDVGDGVPDVPQIRINVVNCADSHKYATDTYTGCRCNISVFFINSNSL